MRWGEQRAVPNGERMHRRPHAQIGHSPVDCHDSIHSLEAPARPGRAASHSDFLYSANKFDPRLGFGRKWWFVEHPRGPNVRSSSSAMLKRVGRIDIPSGEGLEVNLAEGRVPRKSVRAESLAGA
jgi:hypothetical protein